MRDEGRGMGDEQGPCQSQHRVIASAAKQSLCCATMEIALLRSSQPHPFAAPHCVQAGEGMLLAMTPKMTLTEPWGTSRQGEVGAMKRHHARRFGK